MIYLGENSTGKRAIIARYVQEHRVRRVVVIAPNDVPLHLTSGAAGDIGVPVDCYPWEEATFFEHYYPLIGKGGTEKALNENVLLVISEPLRRTDRRELTYNCMRTFMRRNPHRLIFQTLPVLTSAEDMLVLFDLDTGSRWVMEPLSADLLREASWSVKEMPLSFGAVEVPTTDAELAAYATEKRRLIDSIGAGDPHNIPRALALFSGKAKARWLDAARDTGRVALARNGRLKRADVRTYADVITNGPVLGGGDRYTLLEFPHRFTDFASLVANTLQTSFDALVTGMKVDQWYFDRFVAIGREVQRAYALLRA